MLQYSPAGSRYEYGRRPKKRSGANGEFICETTKAQEVRRRPHRAAHSLRYVDTIGDLGMGSGSPIRCTGISNPATCVLRLNTFLCPLFRQFLSPNPHPKVIVKKSRR